MGDISLETISLDALRHVVAKDTNVGRVNCVDIVCRRQEEGLNFPDDVKRLLLRFLPHENPGYEAVLHYQNQVLKNLVQKCVKQWLQNIHDKADIELLKGEPRVYFRLVAYTRAQRTLFQAYFVHKNLVGDRVKGKGKTAFWYCANEVHFLPLGECIPYQSPGACLEEDGPGLRNAKLLPDRLGLVWEDIAKPFTESVSEVVSGLRKRGYDVLATRAINVESPFRALLTGGEIIHDEIFLPTSEVDACIEYDIVVAAPFYPAPFMAGKNFSQDVCNSISTTKGPSLMTYTTNNNFSKGAGYGNGSCKSDSTSGMRGQGSHVAISKKG